MGMLWKPLPPLPISRRDGASEAGRTKGWVGRGRVGWGWVDWGWVEGWSGWEVVYQVQRFLLICVFL